jgi:hypothetical protein
MDDYSRELRFFHYAKRNGWDASLCLFNNKFIAIINPVNEKKIFEGQSEISIYDAMDECKKQMEKK